MQKPIFNAYIDGYNLYNGALRKRSNLKWLNLDTFCKDQMPDYELGTIYFFTAQAKSRFAGDDSPELQEKYLRVLRNQGVQVVRGKFRKDVKWLRLAESRRTQVIQPLMPRHLGLTQHALNKSLKLALPDAPKAQVYAMQEKGSDVNLASYLLRDSYSLSMSAALVITGDSDLTTPIKFAVEKGIVVKVLVPNQHQPAGGLSAVASALAHIRTSELEQHQLPPTYTAPSGRKITKPQKWS